MGDSVDNAIARKLALDAARQALGSGSRMDLESAMQGLPKNGRKAQRLRMEIVKRLASLEPDTGKAMASVEGASCVSDGIAYEFYYGETGEIAFFSAERVGARIRIKINAEHPFGQLLSEDEGYRDPKILTLMAAWAHYELEQDSMKRQGAVEEARIDWGRIVRRLLAAETSGFRFSR